MAADTVKLTFEGVDDVSQVINKINKGLEGTGKQTKKTTKSTEVMGAAMKAAGAIISAYMVKQVAEATVELAKLGAKAELVEKNFRNFATNAGKDANKMMVDLRKATLGMVDDIKLQQNAMKAMISGVEFDDMITAMEYVTKYAAATGDDVNVKMTTVMTGLARKSALFMDDVGIQVMGAEDVVRATIDQMKEKMGQFASSNEDAAVQVAQLASEFRNAAKELGKAFLPALKELMPLLKKSADFANLMASGIAALTNKTAEKNEQIAASMEKWHNILVDATKKYEEFLIMQDKNPGLITEKHRQEFVRAMADIDTAKQKLAELRGQTLAGPKPEAKAKTQPKEEFDEAAFKAKIKAGEKALSEIKKQQMEEAKAIWDLKQKRIDAGKTALDEIEKQMEEEAKYFYELSEKKKSIQKEIETFGLSASQIEINRINDEFQQKKALFGEQTEEWIALEQERIERINEVKDAEKEKTFETASEALSFAADTAMQVNGVIQQAFSSRYARERAEIDNTTAKRREAIKESTLSEKQKNKELEKLDKEAAKKRHEVAMGEWRTNLIMAIANTALGVTKALSSSSPPLNFVMAALTGAAGAASIATIAANKPKFATGGIVPGNSFSGDQVTVGVNSGERIITNSQQNRLTDILEGRGSLGKSQNSLAVSTGDTNITINGNANEQTVSDIANMMDQKREETKEMIYEMFDKNEFDTSRTPFVTV